MLRERDTGMNAPETMPLDIPGLVALRPERHEDERGTFTELFTRRGHARAGIDAEFIQDNLVRSHRANVIRGLHYQAPPHAQGKLVCVLRGRIFDVAVDIRHGSPTFGRHAAMELSAENGIQMWIPPGFAHGYCTLEPDTLVLYKVTAPHVPESEFAIAWNDPDLDIPWPEKTGMPLLSERDARAPRLRNLPEHFTR